MSGKNPTRKQKVLIKKNRLNPENWLVIKVFSDRICIQNKSSKKIRELKF